MTYNGKLNQATSHIRCNETIIRFIIFKSIYNTIGTSLAQLRKCFHTKMKLDVSDYFSHTLMTQNRCILDAVSSSRFHGTH